MDGTPPPVSTSRALTGPSEFGPFDILSDIAHRFYVDGFSEQSIRACAQWLALTVAGGDVITTRYLLYIQAIALEERGRNDEAIGVARELLADLGDDLEPMWRAKALSVVAESSTRLGKHGDAIAALAEADWLLQAIPTDTYGHLSASMAVALALRSLSLLEQADAALSHIRGGQDAAADVYLMQELALLSTYWGAALLLIGYDREAAAQFVVGASRARAMVRLAAAEDDVQMVARGEVIEAFTVMHLGEPALAAARVRSAAHQFVARPELVETHLMHLVLAQEEATAGKFGDAERRLTALVSHAELASREVWAVTARASLAGVHETHFGAHPGLDEWRTVQRYPSGFRFPDGESFTEMQTRITGAVASLVERHAGGVVVCVSHADPIKAAVADALGTHLDLFQRIVVSPCSVTAVAYGPGGPAVLTVNHTTGTLADLKVS